MSAYSSAVLGDSPLVYPRQGDASGTTMTDSSGNSHAGSYVGSPTLGVTGLLPGVDTDTAVDYGTSASKYGTIPAASWMNVSAFSVEAIIKSSGSLSSYHAIVSRDGSSPRGWTFYVKDSNLYLDDPFNTSLTGSTTLAASTRYHVVMTYDGTTIKFYVNGSPDGSVAHAINSTTNDMRIAANVGQGAFPFGGVIDEVAYYGSALSAAQVAAHYAASTPNATVAPPAATATATAPTPVVSGGSTVAPPVATATASAPVPVITSGTNATVAPPAATATAMAPVPTITQVIPAGTDTTNFLNGRNRRARASVTVIRPVASPPSNLATKHDKAVPLPPPTLVAGRVQ